MPYEWICESCGLRLYSASAETGIDRCPRCGAFLPEPTDAAPLPPPDDEGDGDEPAAPLPPPDDEGDGEPA